MVTWYDGSQSHHDWTIFRKYYPKTQHGKFWTFFGLLSLHNSIHCDPLEEPSPRMEAFPQSSLDGKEYGLVYAKESITSKTQFRCEWTNRPLSTQDLPSASFCQVRPCQEYSFNFNFEEKKTLTFILISIISVFCVPYSRKLISLQGF